MKAKTVFCCSDCGYEAAKWVGKCPSCGGWNTLSEQRVCKEDGRIRLSSKPLKLNEIKADEKIRISTGIKELDSVLGGGLCKGSLVLLGGEPGIGKSTLLLEACQGIGDVLYISGEESEYQIKMRADRLGISAEGLYILPQTDLDRAFDAVDALKPSACVVDSVQTMYTESAEGIGGGINQIKEVTMKIMQKAKSSGIAFFLVGHVTKDGNLAGPRILEHMVDAVLYFEGERNQSYRVLRAVKNRFGSTNEIAVFEMTEDGLKGVDNPSAALLTGRAENASGSSVTCLMEGTRPILTEIQALTSPTGFGIPKRASQGIDYNRLSLIIAIIEKKLGLTLQNQDVYVNAAGGIRIGETVSDLALIAAIISSLKNIPLCSTAVFVGEAGLSGEVRAVGNVKRRVLEAMRMGFTKCVIPRASQRDTEDIKGIEIIPVATIRELIKADIYENRQTD